MRRKMVPLACFLLAASLASAAELAGVTMPDKATVDGRELVLNGLGLREKLWVDVYVAGLYLEHKTSDAQQILGSSAVKHLRMQFVYKKVEAKKLVDAWTEGLAANAGGQMEQLRPGLDRLNSWMEDVVKGDVMSFTAVPGKGLEVTIKGQSKGVIEDPAFASAFWSIFLGAKPPTASLKEGLLGAG